MTNEFKIYKNKKIFRDLDNSAGLFSWINRNTSSKISWKYIRRKYPIWFDGNKIKKDCVRNLKELLINSLEQDIKSIKISYDEVQENNVNFNKLSGKVHKGKFYNYKLVPLPEHLTVYYKTIFGEFLDFLKEAEKLNSEIICKW